MHFLSIEQVITGLQALLFLFMIGIFVLVVKVLLNSLSDGDRYRTDYSYLEDYSVTRPSEDAVAATLVGGHKNSSTSQSKPYLHPEDYE